jgi:hypothetical protein
MVHHINILNGNSAMETNLAERLGLTNLPQVLKNFIPLLTKHLGWHMLQKKISIGIRNNIKLNPARLS